MSFDDKKFSTRAIHAGYDPKDAQGARQVPIYQTSAYKMEDAKEAADKFSLKNLGYSYTRISNPTNEILESRLASLEGGVGATLASSGIAGQMLALSMVMQPGKRFIASNRLYGGTTNQFQNTFRRHFGWQADFVDLDDLDAVKAAITDDTQAIFAESLANPGGVVIDIEAISKIAKEAGIPLMVDNTMATPYLCRPIEWGADFVLHSTTKFLNGHCTAMGGVVIDAGTFDWSKNASKFPLVAEPDPSYNGLNYVEEFGDMAATVQMHAIGLRDLGPTQSPFNSFMTLTGMETLGLRMDRHVENAKRVAEYLEAHDAVSYVTYASLPSSKYHDRAQKYLPKGAGAVFTFGMKDGYDAAKAVVANLDIFSIVANIGDTRSMVIHPASTTHSQVTSEHRKKIGLGDEMIRISVGIEDADDLIADLEQAIASATDAKAAA